MARDTLLGFFEDFSKLDATFIVHDDGYRVRQVTYQEVWSAAHLFANRLIAVGTRPGDKVVIWSENRAEWIIAQWGCLLAQGVVVPVDFRASADLVARISAIVNAKIVLLGNEVTPTELTGEAWRLTDVIGREVGLERPASRTPEAKRGAQASHTAGPVPVTSSTLAEIIFTSGATAEPKGVTITHKNLLANIVPIEREMAKYKKYARPFQPLRFLNLLPLSHMFGQSMATFVPPMLAGTVVFSHGYSPVEILRQIKSRRISVLVCVPKVLSVLREHVERVEPLSTGADPLAGRHWAWRWWHYRSVHRLFGLKFWCIVCGAAPLDPELEAFWRKLGFLVVQGYGLTETAPIVTLNHPFHASRGTVGRPIEGVEVKIAADGEILVRGENVTPGYYKAESASGADETGNASAAEESAAFKDGWFHTGDIGELDADGCLLIKGRKKEMIVTAQGLNVFPEDVERALLAQPGVTEAGVVGVRVKSEERVHAVLVVTPGADLDAIVRGANQGLGDHQRISSASVWPGGTLPRTEGTQKLKRRELQRWAAGDQAGGSPRPSGGRTVVEVVGRFAPGRTVGPGTTLDELGLGSLDRVELMMALEEVFATTLDETTLVGTRTIREIETLVKDPTLVMEAAGSVAGSMGAASPIATAVHAARTQDVQEPINFPSWNRSPPSWFIRRISLPTWILPLARIFLKLDVRGLEHLASLNGPVLFAANHQSHMDGPAILLSLPARWRYHVAPAMAKEFFKAHFNPGDYSRKAWFTNSLNYYLACQFFNAFPLPQREAGTRHTLRYLGDLTGGGYSILIFPEGRRTQDGSIGRFMPGVGMIASRLGVPVIPVRLDGLDKVLHSKMKFPVRGSARVTFGAPLRLTGAAYAALAKEVEDAVRRM